MPAAEYEALLAHVPADAPARSSLQLWYRRDDNHLPEAQAEGGDGGDGVYVLRRISEVVDERGGGGAGERDFAKAEPAMAALLREAAEKAALPADRAAAYNLSVTAKELAAATDPRINPRTPSNVLVVQRTLDGLRDAAAEVSSLIG